MRIVDIIEKKRDGEELNREQIEALILGYVKGQVPDYQVAAFLMAVVFRGMTDRETAILTDVMMHSGDTVDLSSLPGIKVDKHSTGGVGDTTTLIVAPLVAACGGTVAKMSGRGLGHTGGTLDKLESIPGVNIEQPLDRFMDIVRRINLAVIGQSGNLVPADKKLYAMRDVTATIGSTPLIASSIMSKKLAAGADAIVLDVKVGSGAFMHTVEDAKKLASLMVRIGDHLGRRCEAIITDMNQPLGLAVGNALEVQEAVNVLSGLVPEEEPLVQVSLLLGAHMLLLSNLASTEEEGKEKLLQALRSGAGLEKLRQMIAALGGDPAYIDAERIKELCRVNRLVEVYPLQDGFLAGLEAEKIGIASQMLGAGRAKKEDTIDPAVGLIMHRRVGDRLSIGEPFCTLYVNDETHLEEAVALLHESMTISLEKPAPSPLVYAIVKE
ncbi:MAG: pyrimidine-nucleoside phosphorylase [Clostridia bacterium]|nr:pyrimidine-nucleoside phosphorylase [Clostridia bacterium]